ncbi:MAG: hypothetical protein JSV88_07665 [Candidatus Aminicenantes bacterium]|nr:MAG: hypothetical protein JSV88_07665 [Candidatus Aminicenantes bacterium]
MIFDIRIITFHAIICQYLQREKNFFSITPIPHSPNLPNPIQAGVPGADSIAKDLGERFKKQFSNPDEETPE